MARSLIRYRAVFQSAAFDTGEDVIELQGHGGPVVMQMLLSRCLEAGKESGLRLAEPGESHNALF
jgi:tRNA modification GTPase